MKAAPILLAALSLATGAARAVTATDEHQHAIGPDEKLGAVDFPVDCAPATQAKFNRATALLHSFAYEQAEQAFADIVAADPSCAMGHWGIAMSLFHPIWAAGNPTAAPSAADLERGWQEVQKAKTPGARTAREQDYVAAVEAYYKDAATLDHPTRAAAFARAMEQVQAKNPRDREAAVFYALALLGTVAPADKSYAVQKKAAEILNRVLLEAPDHPGIAHYLIHSFDYPQLASLALPAARAYARIAPSAPHALHMPSHIFTRLALWDESIEANLASAEAARRWVARAHPGATAFDELHALDYLEYAYLQTGRDAEATRVLDRTRSVGALDVEAFSAAYALVAIPARHALERHDWKAAAGLVTAPSTFPWSRFPYAEALIQFARAVGGARGGQLEVAHAALDRLTAFQAALAATKDAYWAGQVEIQRRAAAGWIAHAEGRAEEARQLLRQAAFLEDATEKHPVTPGAVLPAREQLADLLLETGDAKSARAEYETSMRTAPGRYNALVGAARAAEASGDGAGARAFYTKLVAQCAKADPARIEISKARAILEKKP